MSSRKRRDLEAEAFAAAMRGVERLGEAPGRVLPRRRRPAPGSETEGPRFDVSTVGASRYARREDVSQRDLEALRDGALEPANRLDMHGMSEEAAREQLFRFIRQASRSGLRCVAIVHGRGLRSPDGPVLKEALPGWLTQLPLASRVAAFASAPRQMGGDGVTLVLLDG